MQDTIAVIFDFDETLAPDSTSSFLDSIGIETKAFWRDDVQKLLDDGWDPVLAYLHKMLEFSKAKTPCLINNVLLSNWGRKIKLYGGATRVFGRLRKAAREIDAGTSVEFYLISSGIGDILRTTKIAKEFTSIWACEFAFDSHGAITWPKNIVSFTDKTRYIFHVSKGLIGVDARTKPFEVNRKFAETDLRIPLNQMIFVGDGYTDIPCFSLIRKSGGVAIGVYDAEDRKKWGRAWGFIEDDRVSNLVPADYSQGSALSNSLHMAVQNIATRVALRRKTYQG